MPDNTPKDASLQSTKQMLDELDALMEKMLTLPVNDLEGAAPFPPPIVQEPALSATLMLLDPSDEAPPPQQPAQTDPAAKKGVAGPTMPGKKPKVEIPAPPPLPFNPPHFEMPPEELSEAESLRFDETGESPEPTPLTNEVVPMSALAELDRMLKDVADPPASSLQLQWIFLPLAWVNQGFDGTTLVFGGAGKWMRSEGGRMLLGFLGVALLAAAVVWFLKDWLGWNW